MTPEIEAPHVSGMRQDQLDWRDCGSLDNTSRNEEFADNTPWDGGDLLTGGQWPTPDYSSNTPVDGADKDNAPRWGRGAVCVVGVERPP